MTGIPTGEETTEQTIDPALAELKAAADAAPTNSDEAKAKLEAEKAAAEQPQKPENVPDKFWDAEKGEVRTEELLKSYTELESGKAPKEEEAEETTEETTEEETEEVKPATKLVADLTEAYLSEEGFTEEHYAQAAELGFDKEFVDQYAAGQQALADEASRRIETAAGGKDNMDSMFAWASTSLSKDEVTKFNASFQGNDVNAAVLAMETLKAKHSKATGAGKGLVQGKSTATAIETFKSQSEVTAAMSDPRYKRDPAYRAYVAKKLAQSKY